MDVLIGSNLSNVAVLDPFAEFDVIAQRFWDSWDPETFRSGLAPRLDVYEDKGNLVIKAELPGINKDDLDISFEGDMLTIKADKKQDSVSDDIVYYACERNFGHYSRSISLPFPIDFNNVSATLENGILEMKLPRTEEAKPKKIEVTVK